MHHRAVGRDVRVRVRVSAVVCTLALCTVGCAGTLRASPSTMVPAGTMAEFSPGPPAPPPSMAPATELSPAAPTAAPSGATDVALGSPAGGTPGGTTGSHGDGPATTASAAPAPMLVYTATVDLQTAPAALVSTLDRVTDVATALGGYLVRRTDTSVQVRVPSARFREGLGRVETLGDVLHRTVSADDVSEEYRDLDIRLQNLRAVRHRLEEFLARAGSMQDTLTVERELERVSREIDTLEGRLRFLSARVAYSLVTVNVQPRPGVVVVPDAPRPSRRALDLPVAWLSTLGLDRLMQFH